MTSEQRVPPFRMPGELFAELAAGGGSARAVTFLEQGERARRLLLLRTLLDHLHALPTPLTPAAEAWRVFKEAAERAPVPVERLLLAPTTGAWIAHMLRRTHGTATGPPLWAEAGRLNVLAVTASLLAGTETVLRVPLTDGALPLPGLGLARLTGGTGGVTTGRARTRAGRLTLTGPDRSGRPTALECRPTPVPITGAGRCTGGPGTAPKAPSRSGGAAPVRPEGPRAGASVGGSGADGTEVPTQVGTTGRAGASGGGWQVPTAGASGSVGAARVAEVSGGEGSVPRAAGSTGGDVSTRVGEAGPAGASVRVAAGASEGGLPVPVAQAPGDEQAVPVAGASGQEGAVTVAAEGPGSAGAVAVDRGAPPDAQSTAAPAGDAVPCWLPLRTLTHCTATGPVAIALEDLDPYRDLDGAVPPARLDADEAEAWQRLFDEAAGILAAGGAAGPPGRLDPCVIRAVVPWERTSPSPEPPPDVRVSASSGDSYGAMVIARPSCAASLAEAMVHEFQHSKLAALVHLFPLLDDDRAERFYAPWRPDPRHLTGLLHGAYAFTGVAGFWRDHLADREHAEPAAYHFALRRIQARLVVRTLLTSGRLTPAGHGLVGGLARTLDGWLREPVDPAALARARTAAALHRTEWRLRNVAPPEPDGGLPAREAPGTGGDLRLRPDRTPWPDTRTHAFAARPAAPRIPDEHLAAGDAAAALDGYAEALDREPGDPHTLAGWIVARASLDRGRAARRLLARPELAWTAAGGSSTGIDRNSVRPAEG
ncbi:HEXXH motif-containing putative peptide modification protein [Streptomyces sp. NPDC005931]|uniref:aKG-HExxH-type peptide beta-hydroxylase n=1 Tax=Streptomyces sp. NPDC005931 TaxID=3364737 RepID=UPI00367F900F